MAWDNDFDNRGYGSRWGRDVWGVGNYGAPGNYGYGTGNFGSGYAAGNFGAGGYGTGNFGAGGTPGYYGGGYPSSMGAGYGYGSGYRGYGGYGGYGGYAGYGEHPGYAGGYGIGGYGPGNYGAGNYGASGYGGYARSGYGQEHFDLGYGRPGNLGEGYFGQGNMAPGTYGQGPFVGRGPRNYQRSDARIEEDINDRLTSHPGLDATDVQVKIASGEVTLTGNVDSRWAKREVEDIADWVAGVKDVHNQLTVRNAMSDREIPRTPGRESRTSSESAPEARSRGRGSGAASRG